MPKLETKVVHEISSKGSEHFAEYLADGWTIQELHCNSSSTGVKYSSTSWCHMVAILVREKPDA